MKFPLQAEYSSRGSASNSYVSRARERRKNDERLPISRLVCNERHPRRALVISRDASESSLPFVDFAQGIPRRILSLLTTLHFTVNFANLTGCTCSFRIVFAFTTSSTSLNLRNWISRLSFFSFHFPSLNYRWIYQTFYYRFIYWIDTSALFFRLFLDFSATIYRVL